MDLKEAIYNRRSIRIFKDKEIELEKIQQIVDAAQWAPSACNKQGWRFIAVVDNSIKERIVKQASANRLIGQAPTTIFVIYEKHLTKRKHSNIQSASAAIQNLLLMAHSLDLGATWLTGLGNLKIIGKILKVPKDYEIIAGIILGYPQENSMVPKRKQVQEILSFDYFDSTGGCYPFTYNVKKWPLEKIVKFREDSLCAASPSENHFSFGRKEESKQEINFFLNNISENDKILEIMPFAGSHTLGLLKAKNLSHYHIFELSEQPIEFTSKKLLHNGINQVPEFSIGKPDKIPYPDNHFDSVVVFQKLEMLPDLKILAEIFRVLKPGGKFIFSFRNMLSLYGLYYWYKFRLFPTGQIWNYGPFTPLNYFKIKKMLSNKFEIKAELGITPLLFIGRVVNYPFSLFSRLIIFKTIVKK